MKSSDQLDQFNLSASERIVRHAALLPCPVLSCAVLSIWFIHHGGVLLCADPSSQTSNAVPSRCPVTASCSGRRWRAPVRYYRSGCDKFAVAICGDARSDFWSDFWCKRLGEQGDHQRQQQPRGHGDRRRRRFWYSRPGCRHVSHRTPRISRGSRREKRSIVARPATAAGRSAGRRLHYMYTVLHVSDIIRIPS